jgi:mono/diheme cytochrome c family protein
MSARKKLAIAALAIVVVGVVAVSAITLHLPDPQISPALAQRQPTAQRGEYVAQLGDCAACHTTANGKTLAGGLPFPTPVGTIYSTNITPDRDDGIGKYDLKDFIRLMRFGVKPDGTRLYPAMPYTAYAKTSDEDLQDLFAYLQQGVAPVKEPPHSSAMRWPLNSRWPLALWNVAFHDSSRFEKDASKDEAWNRGAYLVQGFAHCGTCHTPRGVALQEKDVSGKTDLFLSGSQLAGTSPVNLRGNPGDGLGRWSAEDIALLLKTGRNAHSAVTGPMAEVIAHSTQFMTDQDVAAIATYVKSLSPAPESGRAAFAASEASLKTIMAGKEQSSGGRMFMDSCSACHRLSGNGENFAFPRLAGNATVLNADPSSLIGVILTGAKLPSTAGAPTGLAMPAFGWRYNDADVAQLATYVRSSWGNGATPVTGSQVTGVRKQLEADATK